MIRRDDLFIVATINKTKNSYILRATPPRSLQSNQVCMKVKIELETFDWFDRMEDAGIVRIKPPAKPTLQVTNDLTFGKTTAEKVIDRLKGQS